MREQNRDNGKVGIVYRCISYVGQRIIALAEFILKKYTLPSAINPQWAAKLSANADIIFAEFSRLYDTNLQEFKNISPEQERITQGNSWKIFLLKAYRRTFWNNSKLCPQTFALCTKIPEITSLAYSVLEAGTHLTPHRGVYAGVLRCLIPLAVPTGDCGMKIDGQLYRFSKGTPLVFDDTIEHESWNKTHGRRVVLFIDFVRPLPQPIAALNYFMIWLIAISPFIGRMLRASL